MTTLCPGGGASGPKPGTPEIVTVGATAVAAAIALLGFPELAEVLAPLVAAAPFETTKFCESDPPADPGLTAQDIVDATNFVNPLISLPAQQKVSDWFFHQYWYTICECSGATTPAPGAPSNPGVNTTGDNTGLPGTKQNQTCWTASASVTVPPNAQFDFANLDLWSQLMPQGAQGRLTVGGGSPLVQGFSDLTGWPQILATYTLTGDAPSTSGGPYGIITGETTALSGSSVLVGPHTTTTGATVTGQTGFNVPSTGVYCGIGGYNTDSVAHQITFTWTWTCGSAGMPVQPCCPPDPTLTSYILQILGILQNLQLNPPGGESTGWADATAHPNLSGTGSFQLGTNVTGIRANFSVIPSNIRITAGTPTFYWDLGFVTPVAIDVPLRSLRTVFAAQDMPLPPQATAIDYTFPPGAIVTLTELIPT